MSVVDPSSRRPATTALGFADLFAAIRLRNTARPTSGDNGSLLGTPEAELERALRSMSIDVPNALPFFDRYARAAEAIRTAPLSRAGGRQTVRHLRRSLQNRLARDELIRRFPHIQSLSLDAPIFITGFPRSGTTHMHRCLASVSGLRHTAYWETIYPTFEAGWSDVTDGEAQHRAQLDVGAFLARSGYARSLHGPAALAPEEDHELLALDFTHLPMPLAVLPEFTWARTGAPNYADFRLTLQALQFLRGQGRWLLKSPFHLGFLPQLFAEFPDATVVVMQRNPTDAALSTAVAATLVAAEYHQLPNPSTIFRSLLGDLRTRSRRYVATLPTLPDGATIEISFDDFLRDTVAASSLALDAAGVVAPRAREAIAQFAAANPRGRNGSIDATFGDFGTTRSDVEHYFADDETA